MTTKLKPVQSITWVMTGPEFKALLLRIGITQEAAADRLTRNPSTIRRWIAGKNPIPKVALRKIERWES